MGGLQGFMGMKAEPMGRTGIVPCRAWRSIGKGHLRISLDVAPQRLRMVERPTVSISV